MRWFKHFNDALDDPFIQELLENFSHAGYVAWFGILEIIAKENGNNLTGKLSIDPVYLKRKMHISVKRLGEIYEFCSRKLEENSEKTPRKVKLFFEKTLEKWEFYIPKMLELKDNYTKDLQAAGKKPSNHKEAEAEVRGKRKKKETTIPTLPPNPEDFQISGNLKIWAEKKEIPENELSEYIETCLIWHGSKQNKYADWSRTIQNWILKDLKDKPKPGKYSYL